MHTEVMGNKLELTLIDESNPLLKEPCTAWDFTSDGSPTELVSALTRVMFSPNHGGIGLAAPQCGVMKNIFVMGSNENLIAVINPVIDELIGDKEMYLEGCLSYPDLWLHVLRHPECIVSYQTLDGTAVERKHLTDLQARVFLHEFDHLLGITFEERVQSKLSLELAKKRRVKKRRQTEKAIKRMKAKATQ